MGVQRRVAALVGAPGPAGLHRLLPAHRPDDAQRARRRVHLRLEPHDRARRPQPVAGAARLAGR